MHEFELRSSMNKVSSSAKLPPLEADIDFDTAVMQQTSYSMNKAPHTSIRSYGILTPMNADGILQSNRLRAKDANSNNQDCIISKTSD